MVDEKGGGRAHERRGLRVEVWRRRDGVVLAEDFLDVRIRLQARWARSREQKRDELGAVGRELEERLS